jgi:hypothetical protein
MSMPRDPYHEKKAGQIVGTMMAVAGGTAVFIWWLVGGLIPLAAAIVGAAVGTLGLLKVIGKDGSR